jgi:N-acetylmuramoyl-L-alanine amidase
VKIEQKHLSCNYDAQPIPVEFLIIHYSATSLDGLLKIFLDEQAKVSSHFVISEKGEVMELVPCLDGVAYRAWHAGYSRWTNEREWTGFNDFSIGVELINYNGNVFPYAQKQITALKDLIHLLQEKFPVLKSARRILGHEHIAGYRGKIDPGIQFNWKDIFNACYPGQAPQALQPVLPPGTAAAVNRYLQENDRMNCNDDKFWQKLNTLLEQRKI